MTFTKEANQIFNRAINDYHIFDNVDTPIKNPYQKDSIQYSLYKKCWIDTVQWHYEDIIRDPHIDPVEALALKRRIDRSNQDRTDLVEEIDSWFRQYYSNVKPFSNAATAACSSTTPSRLWIVSSRHTPSMTIAPRDRNSPTASISAPTTASVPIC